MTPPVAPVAPAAPQVAAVTPGTVEMSCPVCAEQRSSPQDRFCGTCRYDYVLRKPFGVPEATPAAVQDAQPEVAAPAAEAPHGHAHAQDLPPADPALAAAPSDASLPAPHDPGAMPLRLVRWEAVAVADPALCDPDTAPPSDVRERIFPIEFPENLIGRRSNSPDVHPEISVTDPGVSKRHARIDRTPDGALRLLDLGSTNGTRLNGSAVEPNVPYPLSDGDVILLGAYTRMTIKGH